ncbi:MAG TPA: porin family protein [Chryseolinea sp.]|nr:porin family protein [Chryseolinea sp.]
MSIKNVIPSLLFLFSATNAIAQVSFGIKGGLNYNDTFYSDGPMGNETQGQLGFHIGGYSRIKISERLSIIPELQYIGKGFQFKIVSQDYRTNLNYLEIPVMLSYSVFKSFGVDLGPTTGMKISSKRKYDGGRMDLSDLYNKTFEFGVTGGLHCYVTDKLKLTASYYRGFTSIRDINISFGSPKVLHEYNTNFQFSVSYSIITLR